MRFAGTCMSPEVGERYNLIVMVIVSGQQEMSIVTAPGRLKKTEAAELAKDIARALTNALAARVRSIHPAAFTKVSALGIEEQRVDAVLDLSDPYEKWQTLGHGFRVMVQIVKWQAAAATRVPLGALFR